MDYFVKRPLPPRVAGERDSKLDCPRSLVTLTRSASEGVKALPRLRFGLVWNVSFLAAGSIANDMDRNHWVARPRAQHRPGREATRSRAMRIQSAQRLPVQQMRDLN